jgi:aspartyl-tRNA(Asn)/glutamyl-tRNA(Gln) amidotransferase subunit B
MNKMPSGIKKEPRYKMNQATEKKYETVIGLEVHLQLDTKTKIFCACANTFGREANSLTCPVCLGLPGTLPVLNRKALEYAIKIALALNCQVNHLIKFDRKNYYYPDLPKGYQISQFDKPIARDGHLDVILEDSSIKGVRIHRAHLEEDAGKLIHDAATNSSLVDYNRTGTPLMEIVTEPDLRSAQEAYDYLTALKLALQYLNVSDCDMEKGSLRCDANVSIRPAGETKLGTKTELKNMNSFRAVKAAIDYEVVRQQALLESGGRVIQETRLWDENKAMTFTMRSKEEAHDYRYFPEPDLVPFTIDEVMIERIRKSLPESPFKKMGRLTKDYGISAYDSGIIIQDLAMANFFEACVPLYKDTKKICNWLNGALLQELNSRKARIGEIKLVPKELTELIRLVEEGIVSNLGGKEALKFMLDTGRGAQEVVAEKGLAQVSDDSELEKIVDEVIAQNVAVAEQIKQGKESAAGFLVGQAMRKTQGKANPKKIGDIIKRRLLNG